MKKVRRRGMAVALIAAMILGLMGLYLIRLAVHGGDWAGFPANGNAYADGRLSAGTITDRNGTVLYRITGGQPQYAQDASIRQATLHAVGDPDGNIGTGAIRQYAGDILGYDFINGLYTFDGAGGTLTMSLDAKVCTAALEALAGRSGAVAVMNYVTGELVCNVSSPTFDPASPPVLSEDDTSGVYLNRVTSCTFTPGSIFKLVTLAAAIENLEDLFDRDFHCDGSLSVGGDRVTCTAAHGDMKIEDALANSCNCVFASLALELGGETIASYAQRYGLLQSQSVDAIPCAAGRYDIQPDGSAALAWSGVGQDNDLVNPAAMLRLMAAIANSGRVPEMTQRKVSSRLGLDYEQIMEPATAGELARMMDYNVSHTYGNDRFPGLALRAKSGTAEVGSSAPNAWFVGFIEDGEHPYCFVVCIENGGGGSAQAGPVANAVLQAAVGD